MARYIFGGDTGESPETVRRKREIAAQLMGQTSGARNVGEGFNAMMKGLVGGMYNREADRMLDSGQSGASDLRSRFIDMIGGGNTAQPSSSFAANATPMDSGVQRAPLDAPMDYASQRVDQAHATGGGLPSVEEMSAYIAQVAPSYGIDPDTALRVARSEGLAPGVWQSNVQDKRRGREPSYGPFQLLVGGEGGWPGGMGNDFVQQTGLDPSDPSNWRQTVDFALANAAQGGWGPWYGAANVGIGNWDGIQRGQAPAQAAPENMAVGESMPMPQGGQMGAQAMQGQQPAQMAQAGGMDMQLLMEVLGNRFMDEGTKAVATAMLQQQMQQQQNQQQLQQRMGAAQAAGIDPRYAGDDEIWKAGVGQHFQDPTTDMQEYEYARQQGFPGSFQDFQIAKRQAGASQTNVDARNMGSIPPGYSVEYDEANNPVQMNPIPGGPVDREIQQEQSAAEAAQRNAADYARTVTQDIGAARGYLDEIAGTAASDGIVGANLRTYRAGIPGTPEYNMAQFFKSAESNIILDTINRMRETSSSGATGMGNMSERQMDVIRGVIGRWEPGLPLEEQRYIMNRISNFYMDVQFGTAQERAEAVRDGRMTQEESDAIQELYEPDMRDVRGRRLDEGGADQPAAGTGGRISDMTDEELEAIINGER